MHPDAVFVEGDLADRETLDRVFAEHAVDAVMHFASHTLVGESIERPFLYLADNVTNGLNLLEAAVDHGVRKFILSSTANLFDEPERMPIAEEERIVPGSPYGESKLILERILHWLDRTATCATARCATSTRREPRPSTARTTIPRPTSSPWCSRSPSVNASTSRSSAPTIRPPTAPACATTSTSSTWPRRTFSPSRLWTRGSRTYNLGNGKGFSVREVIDTARSITGHEIPTAAGARRAGDPATLVASSEKIQRELGWRPSYPGLSAILETAWSWHQRHPRGYAGDSR